MKRNLKFWTRHTWESIGVDMLIVAVFSGIVVLTNSGIDWSLFVSAVPLFLIIAAIFGMILINSLPEKAQGEIALGKAYSAVHVLLGEAEVKLCGETLCFTLNGDESLVLRLTK